MKASASSRLVAYLEEHRLSHATFAVRVEANRSQIYRLTVGERGPSIDLAKRIEDATGGAVKATDWAKRKPKKARRVAPRRDAVRVVHGSTVPR